MLEDYSHDLCQGNVQVSSVNPDGQNYLATVVRTIFPTSLSMNLRFCQGPGDIWYFPPGIPHSIQATDDLKDGSEFLLVSINDQFNTKPLKMFTDFRFSTMGTLAKILLSWCVFPG